MSTYIIATNSIEYAWNRILEGTECEREEEKNKPDDLMWIEMSTHFNRPVKVSNQ